MSHANACLTPRGRLKLARCVVEEGWSLRRAAERFQVSVPTAQRWAARYRESGQAGMLDRSSRPHHSPNQTHRRVEKKIKHLRTTKLLGPAQIAGRLSMHPSTVHRVITRLGLPKLNLVDQATGEVIRREAPVRYEHQAPGELVHVDIKKLGNIPDGGGWRVHGRIKGTQNRATHRATHQATHGKPSRAGGRLGYSYLHNAVDDHSRLAYVEIHADEKAETAAGFWHRAVIWFAVQGIFIDRVLTDNGSCYRSKTWAKAMKNTDCIHKRTRPYRPQTNGKVERFNRTMAHEWAYARPYASEELRRKALPKWLHLYNHHRAHTALGGQPPASRVTNLSGQYT